MKDGKFLEILVECFQKLLASDGINVSPNEKFRNENKVLIGEVDIVIEGVFNSEYIKIGTECRDRKGRQDRNWIRQIIGKREDLKRFGFTDWVAVSSGGFTSTARELADEKGIRILVPAKVEPVDSNQSGPHKWMKFNVVEDGKVVQPDFRIIGFVIPRTKKVLGLIGINEYQLPDTKMYLIVGIKPDDVFNPVMILRDADGKLMPNRKITLRCPPGISFTPQEDMHPIKFRG